MLAKFSALALFLLHVVALEITAPDSGVVGDSVSIDFTRDPGDPNNVDLFLFDTNSSTNYTVAYDIEAKSQDVTIPTDVKPGTYEFVATEVGNDFEEYAKSNGITIASASA